MITYRGKTRSFEAYTIFFLRMKINPKHFSGCTYYKVYFFNSIVRIISRISLFLYALYIHMCVDYENILENNTLIKRNGYIVIVKTRRYNSLEALKAWIFT